MSPPKHACVRYCDNNICAIVQVTDVKDFHPKDDTDFASHPYLVKWTDRSGNTDFYSARILLLGDSPEEITKRTEAKRVRVRRQLSSDLSDPEQREVDDRPQKKKKPKEELLALIEKKKKALKAKKPDDVDANRAKLKEKEMEISKLYETITAQKRTIDKLRELNEGLQETIISLKGNLRVPASTAPTCSEVVPTRSNLPGMAVTPARPTQPGTAVQTPHLQQTGKKTAIPEKPPQACTQPQSPPYCRATPPALASVSSDKVDIGKGLLVSADTWAYLKEQQKDSIFVKNLLVAVWDPAKLRNKSLIGKHCPRFPDRPKKEPLTPWKLGVMRGIAYEICFKDRLHEKGLSEPLRPAELQAFNRYVSEKLADIEEVARRTEQPNKAVDIADEADAHEVEADAAGEDDEFSNVA